MRLQNYLTEAELAQYIIEKMIQLKSTQSLDYGNIIILAGGGGSGKGFATSHFLEGSKFKIRDVDELKKLYMKFAELKNKYPEIQHLTLKNPKHVNRLHQFITKKKIKDKTLNLLLKDTKQGKLPNILFDMTLRTSAKANFIKTLIEEGGYNAKNINLIWVLTDYYIAVEQNKKRDRIVPADILLKTHEGAALTMTNIIKGGSKLFNNKKYFDGGIYVILAGKNHSIVFDTVLIKKDNAEKFIPNIPRVTKKFADRGWTITGKKGGEIKTKSDPAIMKKLGFKTREPEVIIKDFKYLQVKEQGKPITTNKELMERLHQWVINNIPPTIRTGRDIWTETDKRT